MNHLEFAARYHQQELLHEARAARLVRDASPGHQHAALRGQLTAALVALLMVVTLISLI